MSDKKISQLTAATTPLAGTEEFPLVQSGVTKKVSAANLTAGRAVSMGNLTYTGTLTGSTEILNIGSGQIYKEANGNFGLGTTTPNTTLGSAKGVVINGGSNSDVQFRLQNNITGSDGSSGALFSINFTKDIFLWNYEDANFKFGTNGIERFRLTNTGDAFVNTGNLVIGTAGKGIDFSADGQAAGMTSELLDDYEEGTFTPTIVGTTSAGTATYTVQLGYYQKVGNMVTVNIALVYNSHTGTGDMRFSGLPFTTFNAPVNTVIAAGTIVAGNLTFSDNLAVTVVRNSIQIVLRTFSSASAIQTVPIDAAAELYCSITYQAA